MAFVVLGEFIHFALPLPIPASIWGLVLLFTALATKIIKLEQIEGAANFMLAFILLLFVVPAVGAMEIFGELGYIWPSVLTIIAITYLAAFASTGYLADFLLKFRNKKARK
jgi:holin-like protein